MNRGPKSIKVETLTAKTLQIALRQKAKQLGVDKYSMAQLGRDAKINHSIVSRAVQYDYREQVGTRLKLETVKKLADTLKIALDPELEDAFYNAFAYASPRQLRRAQSYVERELQAS